jgi:ABC-2 type transport system ATP-binding protein
MKIQVNDLQFKYGREHVLKDIQFELDEPKIYGLLGRNGAGKTTLLSLIASFREPTSGSIIVDGETPFENADIMQQITFLYSKDYTGEYEKVKDLLEAAAVYRPNFDKEYAKELVKKFRLDVKKPLQKLSKGKQAAYNAIIGLASRSPITIFDEVYLGMDAPARDIFYKELLAEQEKHPRIIILSTHLVSEMDHLFDDVLIIKEGRLLLHETYEELTSRGMRLIGGKEAVDRFSKGKEVIHREQLGDTHSLSLYGAFSEEEKSQAKQAGLQISDISLHNLFIQLTKEEDDDE